MTLKPTRAGRALSAVALAAAVTVCAATGPLLAPPAAQATAITGAYHLLDLAAINYAAVGGITVTLDQPNPYDEHDVPFGGVAGTRFTAERLLDFDLQTQAGWDAAAGLDPKEAQLQRTELVAEAFTDEEGVARLEGLPVGVYLVTADTPSVPGYWYQDPQAMVITVPTAVAGSGAGGQWVYQVQVNAKSELPIWVDPCHLNEGPQTIDLGVPPMRVVSGGVAPVYRLAAVSADGALQALPCEEPTEPSATPTSAPSTPGAGTVPGAVPGVPGSGPGAGLTPGAGDAVAQDGGGRRPFGLGSLAMTGVNAAISLGLAAVLTVVGVGLVAHRRRANDSGSRAGGEE